MAPLSHLDRLGLAHGASGTKSFDWCVVVVDISQRCPGLSADDEAADEAAAGSLGAHRTDDAGRDMAARLIRLLLGLEASVILGVSSWAEKHNAMHPCSL